MARDAEKKLQSNESKPSIFDYLRFGESYTSLILGVIVVIIATVLLLSFVHKKNVENGSDTPQTMSQQTKRNVPNLAQDSQVLTATPIPSGFVTATPTVEPTRIPTPTKAAKPTAKPQPTKIVKKVTPVPTKAAKKLKPTQIAKTITPQPTKIIAEATATPVLKKVAQKPAAPKPIKGSTYTVAKGDTLWSIAEKKYKSGYNWTDIARANKLNNASLIHSGNKLVLPEVSPKMATVKSDTKVANKDTKKNVAQKNDKKTVAQSNKISGDTYTVVKGDNLWTISIRAYGDGYQWKKIADANKLVNPSLIHSGNKLKIPRS